MIDAIYDPDAKHCALCGDTKMVEIIPHGESPNDAQQDECPWCLRRATIEARLNSDLTIERCARAAETQVRGTRYQWVQESLFESLVIQLRGELET